MTNSKKTLSETKNHIDLEIERIIKVISEITEMENSLSIRGYPKESVEKLAELYAVSKSVMIQIAKSVISMNEEEKTLHDKTEKRIEEAKKELITAEWEYADLINKSIKTVEKMIAEAMERK